MEGFSTANIISIVAAIVAVASFLISVRNAKLFPNPVVGIRVKRIYISDKHIIGPKPHNYRQSLNVQVDVSNLATGPAISLLGDAIINLSHAVEAMPTQIPQRFDPEHHSYLKAGEDYEFHFSFGHLAVQAVLADMRTNEELNLQRIKDNPTQEAYCGPMVEISIFYQSNLGVYYRSDYKAHIFARERMGNFIGLPDRDEDIELHLQYVPRPSFSISVIRQRTVETVLKRRASLRRLSGW